MQSSRSCSLSHSLSSLSLSLSLTLSLTARLAASHRTSHTHSLSSPHTRSTEGVADSPQGVGRNDGAVWCDQHRARQRGHSLAKTIIALKLDYRN